MLSLVPFSHSHQLVQYHLENVYFVHCCFDRSAIQDRHGAWLTRFVSGELGEDDWEWLSLCKSLIVDTADSRFCNHHREPCIDLFLTD